MSRTYRYHVMSIIGIAAAVALSAPANAVDTSKCISNGVVAPQSCWDKHYGVKGGAHIGDPNGGQNALTAIQSAQSMNRRGVTFVVGSRCDSSCAITWNLAKRKCFYNDTPTVFRQHKTLANGKAVRVHSRSVNYWKTAGRVGPGSGWVTYSPSAKYKCTNAQANMKSTSGMKAPKRSSRTPGIFQVLR